MMMHKNNCNKLLLENRKNVTFTPNIPFLIRGPMHKQTKRLYVTWTVHDKCFITYDKCKNNERKL